MMAIMAFMKAKQLTQANLIVPAGIHLLDLQIPNDSESFHLETDLIQSSWIIQNHPKIIRTYNFFDKGSYRLTVPSYNFSHRWDILR